MTDLPMPTEALSLDRVSKPTREKAKALPPIRQDDYDPNIWWVRSTSNAVYRVQFGRDEHGVPIWVTCSCRYGQSRGGGRIGCSHAVAAYERGAQ